MRRMAIIFGVTAALVGGVAIAQAPPPAPQPETVASRPDATGGEKLFLEHCGRTDVPLLEKRKGLGAKYVITAARQGIGNMPAITRGEVSDADLQAIADYLAGGPHS